MRWPLFLGGTNLLFEELEIATVGYSPEWAQPLTKLDFMKEPKRSTTCTVTTHVRVDCVNGLVLANYI